MICLSGQWTLTLKYTIYVAGGKCAVNKVLNEQKPPKCLRFPQCSITLLPGRSLDRVCEKTVTAHLDEKTIPGEISVRLILFFCFCVFATLLAM